MELDASTISALYQRHSEPMLAYITRRTHDPHAALDLVAETFAQAFRDRQKFRGDTMEQADGWIWSIARRELSDYWRRGKVERKALEKLGVSTPALPEDEYTRVEELAGLREARELVARELCTLRPDQQRAIHLRIVEERPYDEVASLLRVSPLTARARVSRALRQLAKRLDNEPPPLRP